MNIKNKHYSFPLILPLFIPFLFFVSMIGCPNSKYISDSGMLSAIEGNNPEVRTWIDTKPCVTAFGQEGVCSIVKKAKEDFVISLSLLVTSEVHWESNCSFEWEDKNVSEGSLIAEEGTFNLKLKSIPKDKNICTVATIVRDADNEEAKGNLSLIIIVVSKEEYIPLERPMVKMDGNRIYVKGSKFTKYFVLDDGKEKKRFIKINEFDFNKPKKGKLLSFESQTDIGRRNTFYWVTP